MDGSRLKKLRKERNMTQANLAELLNISQPTLGQYETGQRSPSEDVLIKIASIFGVSVDYLLGIEDNEPIRMYPKDLFPEMNEEDLAWLMSGKALKYVLVTKEAAKNGLSPESLQKIIEVWTDMIKSKKD